MNCQTIMIDPIDHQPSVVEEETLPTVVIPLAPVMGSSVRLQNTNAPPSSNGAQVHPPVSSWWHRVVLVGCLVFAGLCFTKGIANWWASSRGVSPDTHAGWITKLIRDVRVGDRVLADNPNGEEGDEFDGEPDSAGWRKVELRATKRDGSWAEVVLLRPLMWLEEEKAQVGGEVEIRVPECSIDGQAAVLAIRPCPPIKSGKGRVVTGTFKHSSSQVVDLYVEGLAGPIGTTANHRFWSEDQQAFVRADALQQRERLRGVSSHLRVLRLVPRLAPTAVYNLEVEGTHVYHISERGFLVHNTGPRKGWIYEITYVKDGVKRVYVGQAGSGVQDVYERLWGKKAGVDASGMKGRNILQAHPDAHVRIWEVDLTNAPAKAKGFLGTQEQHAKEEVMKNKLPLDNTDEARSKDEKSAYKTSRKKLLSPTEQGAIKDEITKLKGEGKKLPASTPAERPVERMSKYDLETLRHGDMRKLVVDAKQAKAKEQTKGLCGR